MTPNDHFSIMQPNDPEFEMCTCMHEKYRHNIKTGKCMCGCESYKQRQKHEYTIPIKDMFESTKTSRIIVDICIHCGNNSTFDRRLNLNGWIRPEGSQSLFCDEV